MNKLFRGLGNKYMQIYGNKKFFANVSEEVRNLVKVQQNKVYDAVIVTVAFNDYELIDLHLSSVKNNLKNKYLHVIVDNSSDSEQQKKIEKVCRRDGVMYARCPYNLYSKIEPSMSHGMALNWAIQNVVSKLNSKYIVFLDHDIFLIEAISLDRLMKDVTAYGRKETRDNGWYLWPGLTIVRRELLNEKTDYRPKNGRDTGGWAYDENIIEDKSKFTDMKILEVPHESNRDRTYAYQALCYEVYDDGWLHMVNGSNWANEPEMGYKRKYLCDYIKSKILN